MMPAYSDNRFYAIYFILFLAVGKCILFFYSFIYYSFVIRSFFLLQPSQVFLYMYQIAGYFFLFIYLGMYFFMNVLLAVIYNQFKGSFTVSLTL